MVIPAAVKNNSKISYKKHLASVAAAYPSFSWVNFISSSLLLPNDSWEEWIDGQGNFLRLSKNDPRIIQRKKYQFFCLDLYSSASLKFLAKKFNFVCLAKKLSCGQKQLYSLDTENIFRFGLMTKNEYQPFPVLSQPLKLSIAVFDAFWNKSDSLQELSEIFSKFGCELIYCGSSQNYSLFSSEG